MVFTTYPRQLNLKAIHKHRNEGLGVTRIPDFGPKIQAEIQFCGHSEEEMVQNTDKPRTVGILVVRTKPDTPSVTKTDTPRVTKHRYLQNFNFRWQIIGDQNPR